MTHRSPQFRQSQPRPIGGVLADYVTDLGISGNCADCGRRLTEPWQPLCDSCHRAARAGETLRSDPPAPIEHERVFHKTPAARQVQMAEGETLVGIVVRLPGRNLQSGNSLFVDVGGETVAIPATAKKGHSVLERELERQNVTTGERIRVSFRGWRETKDGERRYRHYTLERA